MSQRCKNYSYLYVSGHWLTYAILTTLLTMESVPYCPCNNTRAIAGLLANTATSTLVLYIGFFTLTLAMYTLNPGATDSLINSCDLIVVYLLNCCSLFSKETYVVSLCLSLCSDTIFLRRYSSRLQSEYDTCKKCHIRGFSSELLSLYLDSRYFVDSHY